jgi:hypothetical protein
MMGNGLVNVGVLKARQDALDQRVNILLTHLAAIKEGLMESLIDFTTEALAAGLRGVQNPVQREQAGQSIATLALNGYELTIVAPRDAYPEVPGTPLVAQMFVYRSHPDALPWFRIVIIEGADEPHCSRFFHLEAESQRETPIAIGGRSAVDGRNYARMLIGHLYNGATSFWNTVPLGQALDRKFVDRSWGFQPPQ